MYPTQVQRHLMGEGGGRKLSKADEFFILYSLANGSKCITKMFFTASRAVVIPTIVMRTSAVTDEFDLTAGVPAGPEGVPDCETQG
ncbi:hypothetical protein SDJN03_10912, partial [Cucurbita argyrosperma subsp. sororia]